jgi:hypothetical protein
MSIRGYLSDCHLPEIFQFIEQGNRSGLLTFLACPETPVDPLPAHYIWVEQGQVVAAANRLDGRGLVTLIVRGKWVSDRVVAKLAPLCPPDRPLGLYLQARGAIQEEDRKRLFQVQILQQVCALCQLENARFKFEANIPAPMGELTGFSISTDSLKTLWSLKELKTPHSRDVLPPRTDISERSPKSKSLIA